MTVDELIEKLQEVSGAGHGDRRVAHPEIRWGDLGYYEITEVVAAEEPAEGVAGADGDQYLGRVVMLRAER